MTSSPIASGTAEPTASVSRPLWKRVLRRPVLTARSLGELGLAWAYVTPPAQALRAWRLGSAMVPDGLRTAVVAHVFYPDIWPGIRAAHANLPAGSPLVVTVPHELADRIARLAAGDPLVEIVGVPNRGRDIAPFLTVLQAGLLDRFDAVLKIHTKKSPHLRHGDLRRRVLLSSLAGSRAATSLALSRFADPRVGLVGPGQLFRTAPAFWMANRDRVEDLAGRMGASAALGFFEGSMFWLRPSALAPLRALGLGPEHFEAEAGQLDGALHHAIERSFPIAASRAGFETRSLQGQVLATASPGILAAPPSEAEARACVTRPSRHDPAMAG